MFKISIRVARELSGYTEIEVAGNCGISDDEYHLIETDPSQVQLSIVSRVVTFLGLPINFIYPGTEADCIKHNRSQN